MPEDAQKQAGRASRTIADETILLLASAVLFNTERFLKKNNNWEDRAEADKTSSNWKAAYKKAHTKACIKAQANKGSVKFGAENSAAILETTQGVETNQGVSEGGMKYLEEYFDNLAAAAVNQKLVIEQLVANNTKLAATNENLVEIVKELTNDIKSLKRETSRLNKTGGQRKRYPTLCPH